jgi:glucosamine--fructose-6-phosphate aminotransferase (isomerizing)
LSKKEAVIKAISEFEGAYAIGIIFADEEGLIYATRHGAPLVVGYADSQKYIASDALALADITSEICYLEEGDIAEIRPDKVVIMDKAGSKVKRKITKTNLTSINIGKENYDHFMQKEIFEQPAVIGDNLHAYFNALNSEILMPQIPFSLKNMDKITIIACGTSYYAAKVASYWLEKIAGIATTTDVASEFRYRSAVLPANGLSIFIFAVWRNRRYAGGA